ncbi:hypothetical protein NEDG_02020 [Nematocida displodere]|uniref:Uncharacterized protein n=1 Tax=Nematocida displodere TaxID=1805483 RepID=A0A177EF51_9MICR|nr:hypothetical protein NEDG_02020 [Nematocida displodere]
MDNYVVVELDSLDCSPLASSVANTCTCYSPGTSRQRCLLHEAKTRPTRTSTTQTPLSIYIAEKNAREASIAQASPKTCKHRCFSFYLDNIEVLHMAIILLVVLGIYLISPDVNRVSVRV